MQNVVKKRLIEYLSYLGIGQKAFAERVGLSAGFVNSIRVSIQPKTLEKISEAYPDLNIAWLLTGDGEMLQKTVQQNIGDISNSTVSGVNVNGSIHNEKDEAYSNMISIVNKYQKSIEKFQEQIDRLLTLLEKSQ